MSVAFVAPAKGQGSVVVILSLPKGSKARPVLTANGTPDRIARCDWVSNERLVCEVYGVLKRNVFLEPILFTRLMAVNADGSNPKVLSTVENPYSHGIQLGGGNVIDWLPDEDGAALIERVHLADEHLGSHIGTSQQGLAVDRIDTRSLAAKTVEQPRDGAAEYPSDGRGAVRIMGLTTRQAGSQDKGVVYFSYRQQDSRDWQKLSDYNVRERSGFYPVSVDHDLNVAYGFKKKDGRFALFSIALDGSLRETEIFARPDVDVDDLMRIGRRKRGVGVSYATDRRKRCISILRWSRWPSRSRRPCPGNPIFRSSIQARTKASCWCSRAATRIRGCTSCSIEKRGSLKRSWWSETNWRA
jgi:hypothetical protein